MQLRTLRSRLEQLRRRRAIVRHSTAWSAVVLAVLWLVLAMFFMDWLMLMSIPQRLVALLISGAITVWVFWRYTKPWLGVKEDIVDVALLVEKHQDIDSDLVAALQFQEQDASNWGSPQLETAVIEYVEEFSPSLNVFEGFTYRRFKRRMAWLAGTLAVLVGIVVIFPQYAGAFADRMLLGSTRYPTDTQIERIAINGENVFVAGGEKFSVRIPYGTPLNFEVIGNGVLPEKGQIILKTKDTDNQVEIELARGLSTEPVKAGDPAVSRDAVPASAESTGSDRTENATEVVGKSDGQAIYQGRLPRLVGSVTYQIYLGDTWSDPLEVEVIPLPVVTVTLDPQPPAYATAGDEEQTSVREGTRQIAVVEGSSVALNLKSTNKALTKAVMTVDDQTYPLKQTENDGCCWTLSGPDSPLDKIRQPVRYSVQVEDEDGLVLEKPIEGYIRIRADRKPRILPPVLETTLVRPNVIPPIEYTVSDDYGISRLVLNVQVVRKVPMKEDGEDGMMDEVDHLTREVKRIPAEMQPLRSVSDVYPLDLKTIKQLNPGDELKVTLEAFDYRGEFEPQSSISEPLVLKVTDKEGILRGMRDSDEKSAQSLDEIIETISGDTK